MLTAVEGLLVAVSGTVAAPLNKRIVNGMVTFVMVCGSAALLAITST
ncbi:MAG: hypothetical protein ABI633_00475 [Burkholderiales bacterium]